MRNDREFIGPFTMRQAEGVFRLGSDSQALGGFAQVKKGEKVLDLGCGGGVLGLYLLSRQPSLQYSGIDISAEAVALTRENFAANGLQAAIVQGDLRDVKDHFPAGSFDLVVSNPPYFASGSGYSGGRARMEEECTLDDVCAAASRCVKNGGRFALVHRPERLVDLLCTLRQYALEPKRLQFVAARDLPPSAVLVECYREGKPGLTVLPPQLR